MHDELDASRSDLPSKGRRESGLAVQTAHVARRCPGLRRRALATALVTRCPIPAPDSTARAPRCVVGMPRIEPWGHPTLDESGRRSLAPASYPHAEQQDISSGGTGACVLLGRATSFALQQLTTALPRDLDGFVVAAAVDDQHLVCSRSPSSLNSLADDCGFINDGNDDGDSQWTTSATFSAGRPRLRDSGGFFLILVEICQLAGHGRLPHANQGH